MSLRNAVTDVSCPPWLQQIELKCEDQISVQQQPGCYPDRSTPRVCCVPFQPIICLRTITCLELPVNNTVGSGSQKHKQTQQSWRFLPGKIESSFVVIWRVLTHSNETELHTPIPACDFSLRNDCEGCFFLRIQVQTPSFLLQKGLQTVIHKYRMKPPPYSPLPDILTEKVLSSLFLLTSGAREKDPAHLHRLQTFTHTTHTCCPWATGRGWGVHGLLRQQFLRWVIL